MVWPFGSNKEYADSQIAAAYNNALYHGYECPSDRIAIKFLDKVTEDPTFDQRVFWRRNGR